MPIATGNCQIVEEQDFSLSFGEVKIKCNDSLYRCFKYGMHGYGKALQCFKEDN